MPPARRLVRAAIPLLGCLLLGACAGPHTTGGLWAEQNLREELAVSRLSDADRAASARTYQYRVADGMLSQERQRVQAELEQCPASGQALGVSAGDRLRDAIRIQAADDSARQASVAELALADWLARRAAMTGDVAFCARAQAALAGQAAAPAAGDDPFAHLPAASVARDPARAVVVVADQPADSALSGYVLGWADAVRGSSPLPAYLATVYGGTLSLDAPAASRGYGDRAPETLVDQFAPEHPQWEPDALYAALLLLQG